MKKYLLRINKFKMINTLNVLNYLSYDAGVKDDFNPSGDNYICRTQTDEYTLVVVNLVIFIPYL